MTTQDKPGGAIMPGGGVARRPLHFLIMADCSRSMTGEKMQALNLAIAEGLSHLADWERDQLQAQVLVRILGFATQCFWHIREPQPVADLRLMPLEAVQAEGQGYTNMGPAFREMAVALRPPLLENRAFRPAILLVTDGRPTDRPGQFEEGLAELMSFQAGRSALRLAIAIGRDAKSEYLAQFIGDASIPVLLADDTDDIVDRLVAVSLAVSRMSEGGADKDIIARRLLTLSGSINGDSASEDLII
jgi:uncharacterized protein YegL